VARQYLNKEADRLAVVGMAGLDQRDAMRTFVDTYGLSFFPQTVSEDGALWTTFGVPFQGTWYFLNQDGQGEVVPYDLDADQLSAQLDRLLAE
jgi:hypothetical protein